MTIPWILRSLFASAATMAVAAGLSCSDDGPASSPVTIVLAHGAGAPMDSPFMAAFADGLGNRGLRVAR